MLCFPKVQCNEKAEQMTGISWDEERMTVHGTKVAKVSNVLQLKRSTFPLKW